MNSRVFPLDAHTWRIEEYNETSSVYMYLLEGEEKAVLIDAGFGVINVREIAETLTGLPISVISTHGHIDHIGGNALFETVFMHEADQGVYQLHSGALAKEKFSGMPVSLHRGKTDITLIQNGAQFDLGGRTLQIIHVPGHTLGSICILDVERRWLFTGDTCCKADVLLNLDFCTTVAEYLETIRNLQTMRPLFDVTWPGHHTVPVEPAILDQFEEACAAICDGTAIGTAQQTPFGNALHLSYRDIGITYLADRIRP